MAAFDRLGDFPEGVFRADAPPSGNRAEEPENGQDLNVSPHPDGTHVKPMPLPHFCLRCVAIKLPVLAPSAARISTSVKDERDK